MKKKHLAQLDVVLKSDVDFVEKINLLSETIKFLVGAELCTIFIYDKERKSFWSAYIKGVSFIELPGSKGIVSDVFLSKEIIIINDVQNDPRFHKSIDNSSGYQTKTMMACTLINHLDQAFGVIQLINKNQGDLLFKQQDKETLAELMCCVSKYSEHFSKV